MPSEFHTEHKPSSTDEGNNMTTFLIHRGKYFTIRKVKVGIRWHVRKELSEEFKDSELHRNLLRKEFEIGQQLEHPNIVRYLFLTDDFTGLYVFMDFIDGETILEILIKNNQNKNGSTQFIRKLITDLSNAFSYLHGKGIFHGDVTPNNILYNKEQDKFYLIDFGFSASAAFIHLGGGTKLYASPESFSAPHKINATSDIYSFGKVLESISIGQGLKVYNSLIKKCTNELQEERLQSFEDLVGVFNRHKQHKTLLLFASIAMFITLLFIGIILREKKTYSNTVTVKTNANKTKKIDISTPKTEQTALVSEKKKVKPLKIVKSIEATKAVWTDSVVNKFGFLQLFEEKLTDSQINWDMKSMRNERIRCIVRINRAYEAFLAASSYTNKEKQIIQDAYIKKYFHEYLKSDTIMRNKIVD